MRTNLFLYMLVCSYLFASVALFANPLFADPAGCCEQRPSIEAPNWYRNGSNFAQCQQLNHALDQDDDIFQPLGKVWWDPNCR